MRSLLSIIISLIYCLTLNATNVQITNFSRTGDEITFDLDWDNSWSFNSGGYTHSDMVYIFIKQAPNGGPSWIPALIEGGTAINNFNVTVPADQLAVRVGHNYQNINANTTVTLQLTGLLGAYQDIKVMALEMVKIPVGAYGLGDGASDRTLHRGNNPALPYIVTSEDAILRGNTSSHFDGGTTNYSGDIAAEFPKGYASFYCMKYPLTQQQYVDFLNCLPREAQDARTNSDLSGTTVSDNFVMRNFQNSGYGNGIKCDTNIGTGNITFYCDLDDDGIPNEADDGLGKVAGFLTNADIYAYLDWAGLAPMTSLQYEKACRGTLPPVAGEFAWGSTLESAPGTLQNNGTAQEKYSNSGTDGGIIGPVTTVGRVGMNAPINNASRELSNASYYGVVDLSGRANTPVIPIGENYIGEQGDGHLTPGGDADFMDISIPLQSKGYSINPGFGRVSSFNGISLENSPRATFNTVRGIWYIIL